MKSDIIPKGQLPAYTLLLITSGGGVLEVDFERHTVGSGKAIFLSPGQYVRIISDDLNIDYYEFQGNPLEQVTQSRYLFKHLVSLGYVDVINSNGNFDLSQAVQQAADDGKHFLDQSVTDWLQLNPFQANRNEIDLLFDLKGFLDEHYHRQPGLNEVADVLGHHDTYLRKITRKKLDSTVTRLLQRKIVIEAKKQLVFTDKSTKELAYDLGFSYPTYFNRFFKSHTQSTPGAFKDAYLDDRPSLFMEDFINLLDAHYQSERFLGFYADELYMSAKTLSAKVRSSFGVGFNDLLNERLIRQGKELLKTGENVTETAFSLGFKEPNHFSAFFKKHTGNSPAAYRAVV